MHTRLTPLLLLLSLYSMAQTATTSEDGGEYLTGNFQSTCFSEQQYKELEQRCNDNAAQYIHQPAGQRSNQSVSLLWPLRAAAGFTDCSYYFIAAHVDQDTATGSFKDYNCGS